MLSPSTNWTGFDSYIFDKNVPGGWGGSVKKLLHIDICLNQTWLCVFQMCYGNILKVQHILLVLLLCCINNMEEKG